MRSEFFALTSALSAGLFAVSTAFAEPKHGIAMYGEPALPPDFVSLPYANPDAPTGGKIVTASVGTFDSLNPFIKKGTTHWQLRFLMGESLMGRSLDEPFALYGVLAESIEVPEDRSWVEFTLHPEAKFSDGSPVTVEDVIWSYEILGTEGHGRYRGFWSKVERLEQVAERTIRFTFNTEDRELALIAGLRPILKKAQWDGIDFTESGVDNVPIVSSEYVITDFEPGRYISFTRDPDYWGADIPFRRGTGNLDELRIEFFGDDIAAFEAFKSGITNSTREFNVAKWDQQFNFPAIQSGEFVKETVQHARPSGMTGFVMNTRAPQFEDWLVRDAMMHVFNFEFINETLTGSAQSRITSYWSNSPLAMDSGPATGRVKEFLDEYPAHLLPGALEGYALPVGDGSERNRSGIAAAMDRMEQAGYTIKDGVMVDASGQPFTFDILIQAGRSEQSTIIDMFVQSLSRIGITPTVTAVDGAQFKEATDAYDFDMTYYRRSVSLSPGNELYAYFGSERANETGGRNLMGVQNPAIDAMVGKLLTSASQDDFVAAVKALDRLLTSGRYVIPIYQWNISRLSHDRRLKHPEYIPIFGDWPGWQPDVWWWEEE